MTYSCEQEMIEDQNCQGQYEADMAEAEAMHGAEAEFQHQEENPPQ